MQYTCLAINAFKHAFDERSEPTGLMFHSDRGANCNSIKFNSLLSILSVTRSLSNPGNPYDNARMKSFFSKRRAKRTKEELMRRY